MIADHSLSRAEYFSEISAETLTETGTECSEAGEPLSFILLFLGTAETWPTLWYISAERGAEQEMQKEKVREPRVCLHGRHSYMLALPPP